MSSWLFAPTSSVVTDAPFTSSCANGPFSQSSPLISTRKKSPGLMLSSVPDTVAVRVSPAMNRRGCTSTTLYRSMVISG